MSNPALDRFIEHLPARPYCTDDLRAGLRIRRKAHALRLPYVQLNQVHRRYVALDLDYAGSFEAWEMLGLPEPTIITLNDQTAHSHYLYELEEPVVFSENARPKPMQFYGAVRRGLTKKFKADQGYVGLITRNPAHQFDGFTFFADKTYTLRDLSEYVDLRAADDYECDNNPNLPSLEGIEHIQRGERNRTLFDITRRHAYQSVRGAGSIEGLFERVFRFCQAVNQHRCNPPLVISEVRSIARSVTRYTWANRLSIIKNTKNRGVMCLGAMPPVMEAEKRIAERHRRKQAGAEYVNSIRRSETEKAIIEAIRVIKDEGGKISKAEVARRTGKSRVLITRDYAHLFRSRKA